MNQKLLTYIAESPTPFQTVEATAKRLRALDYTALSEAEAWKLEPGGKYYVTRNGSSIISFRIPCGGFKGFQIAAAHSDSPCMKIKDNPELPGQYYVRISAEGYGGMIRSTWADRPLSAAGRVLVKTSSGVETRLIDLKRPVFIIPSVAIHMDRTQNDGKKWNPAVDMVPLYSLSAGNPAFSELIAEAAGVSKEDILSAELNIYNPEPGVVWNGMISAPRLDDLQCAFAILEAFLSAKEGSSVPVCCIFDNEEVGSMTKQGASSTFLPDVLLRIAEAFELSASDYRRAVANSFLCSCDNAHAIHPNHPEYADTNQTVRMNGGIVMKYNANQKYTTDGVSAAIFRAICSKTNVPVQVYANRADMAGGSTLGNLVNAQVSLNAVDLGLAQLAMHSAYETAGAEDTEYMVRALTYFYGISVLAGQSGSFTLRE